MQKKSVWTLIVSLSMILVLGGCSSGGAGGGDANGDDQTGDGDGTTSGSATITWEATGSYENDDPGAPEFSISYSWVAPDQTTSSDSVFENEISLPWTHEETLESGTGATMSLTGLADHANTMTLSLYENGVLKASHTIEGAVAEGSFHPGAGGIVHVVGQ